MITVLIICLSGLILSITYFKSKEKTTKGEVIIPELESYYERKSEDLPLMLMQSHLQKAYDAALIKEAELIKEKSIIYSLHHERILSPKVYRRISRQLNEIQIIKKEIDAEVEELEGFQLKTERKPMKDAGVLKKVTDGLYLKKKEVLTKELIKKLVDNKEV